MDSCLYSCTFLAAPAAKLVPNVPLCIPLDYIGEAERGILMTGHPRISTHFAQACALERSLQCRCSSDNTTQETAVTSYKPRVDWRKLGHYGLSLTVGGIIVSNWSANAWAAGQPPVSKLLNRHSLPASMGAWSLGKQPKNRLQYLHQAKQEGEKTISQPCG